MNVSHEDLGILLGIGQKVEAAVIERKFATTFKDANARTTKRVVDSCDLVECVGHMIMYCYFDVL
jgi:hypothetical protein